MARARRLKGNIVAHALEGAESSAKQRQYRNAAHALGLGARSSPDARTLGIFPCSDFLAPDAALIAHARGIPGPDPFAVAVAASKPLAYRFLASKGFATLFWFTPLRAQELQMRFDRPVIVKPERGSGSFGPHPWAYRIFPSLGAFARWLRREGLAERFLAYQGNPWPAMGRYLVMECVEKSPVFGVDAVVSDTKIALCNSTMMCTRPGTVIVDWTLIGYRHRRMREMVAMIEAFAGLGLRRSYIYLQCVEHDGRLFPIDINLRPGTTWNAVTRALGMPFFQRALAFMLGLRRDLPVALPAAYVGVRRIFYEPKPGRHTVSFPAGCIPLISELSYDPRKPYDREHAWPMFGVLCRSAEEFNRRADATIAATVVSPVRRARA